MYLKRLTLALVFSLAAGIGHAGTFELTDPANEIMEEQDNPGKIAQQPGQAGDAGAGWARKGVGNTACSEHLLSKQESPLQYSSNLHWVQGFIEGVAYQRYVTLGDNRLSPDTNLEETALWIENYCIENPFDELEGAARAYLRKLSQ